PGIRPSGPWHIARPYHRFAPLPRGLPAITRIARKAWPNQPPPASPTTGEAVTRVGRVTRVVALPQVGRGRGSVAIGAVAQFEEGGRRIRAEVRPWPLGEPVADNVELFRGRAPVTGADEGEREQVGQREPATPALEVGMAYGPVGGRVQLGD